MGETTEAPRLNTQPPTGETKGPTTHLTDFFVRAIYIYVHESPDRKRQAGSVTFVSDDGRKLFASLRRTAIPAGTWEAELGSDLKLANMVCKFPDDLDPELVANLNKFADKALILTWGIVGKDEEAAKRRLLEIDQALKASVSRTIRLVVSYGKAKVSNITSIRESQPLAGGDNTVLQDPNVAHMYLTFVEHFGKVSPDFSLAEEGLTADEISQVEDDRPELIAITNLFVQCFEEFEVALGGAAAPAPGLDDFRAMTEAIFYQKSAKNDLARRNMLAIGLGTLLERTASGFSSKVDIGVIERSQRINHMLIYDRHGVAIRLGSAPLDREHRVFNLDKLSRDSSIPHMQIEVEDEALYLFLRSVEQQLGDPLRDVEALAASLYKHTLLITNEMHRINAGRIAKRVIDMAPAVLAFFVAHAIVAQLIQRGHPAAAAFSALLVGAGIILGIDFGLMQISTLAAAGRHFARMEELHREAEDKEPKLTALSATHLRLGADLLIDAIEEFIALGVVIVGTLAAGAGGRALKRGLEKQAQARSKLTVENGVATKIESVKPETKPKIGEPKTPEKGLGKGEIKDAPPKRQPIEAEGPTVGAPREGKIPKERTPGAGKVEVEGNPNLDVHIRERDLSVRIKDGIGGAHNTVEFGKAASDVGAKVETRTLHPTMDGVEHLTYRMPKRDLTGKIIEGQFRTAVFDKTVYDPVKVSDAEMLRLGKEAAVEAKTAGRLNREWIGRASNGVIFRGYLDSAGRIKSFFPDVALALEEALKLRVELPPDKFPAQAFFNAVPDFRFVQMLRAILSGAGWTENSAGCHFPEDDDDPVNALTGVRFSLLDEEIVLDHEEFRTLAKEVAQRQKSRAPSQTEEIDQVLADAGLD